jgi:hypothetical protein
LSKATHQRLRLGVAVERSLAVLGQSDEFAGALPVALERAGHLVGVVAASRAGDDDEQLLEDGRAVCKWEFTAAGRAGQDSRSLNSSLSILPSWVVVAAVLTEWMLSWICFGVVCIGRLAGRKVTREADGARSVVSDSSQNGTSCAETIVNNDNNATFYLHHDS